MIGPRFSLANLLGIVAVIALGLTGLSSATTFWTSAAATVTLGLLLAALLGAVLLRGADRAFWLGFALFGGTYLVLVEWDWIGGQLGHDLTAGLSGVADSILRSGVGYFASTVLIPWNRGAHGALRASASFPANHQLGNSRRCQSAGPRQTLAPNVET
jgi:hypothetical protein